MTGNAVTSEVNALIYIVLSRAENSALWGIRWYHIMYNTIDEVSHKPRSFITEFNCI